MKARALGSLLTVVVALNGCSEGDSPAEPQTFVVPVFVQAVDGGAKNFDTHMTAAEEVPPNPSKAQGQAIFQLSDDGTELYFKVNVANIENVLQSHIHNAAAGVNGPIVAWLYPDAPPATLIPGRSQGTLNEGSITDSEVIGVLAGTGVAGLLAEIRAGRTYVNVHTVARPGGEIRGQID